MSQLTASIPPSFQPSRPIPSRSSTSRAEREGLTDFRRLASLQRRHDLAVLFAAFEARNYAGVRPVDKDPSEYVREAEEGGLTHRGGSLSIGSLKNA